jgi:hypothetical protein
VAGAAYLIVLGAGVVRDRPRLPSKEGEPGMSSSMVDFIAIIVGRFDVTSLDSC